MPHRTWNCVKPCRKRLWAYFVYQVLAIHALSLLHESQLLLKPPAKHTAHRWWAVNFPFIWVHHQNWTAKQGRRYFENSSPLLDHLELIIFLAADTTQVRIGHTVSVWVTVNPLMEHYHADLGKRAVITWNKTEVAAPTKTQGIKDK